MCGIIGYVGFEDPKKILLDGLKHLEYRGYDSAGIAILEKGKTLIHRCEGRLNRLEERLSDHSFKGEIGIGHTRWATHGAPTEANAHPHKAGSVTLVHNGIIENYLEHKKDILKSGRKPVSDTDSEIVGHLIDREIEQGLSFEDAVQKVLPTLKGSYAFVILCEKEPDLLIGVRSGAPLLVGLGEKENFIASDVQPILHRTNRIVYLGDRQVAFCRKDGVEIKDATGKRCQPEVKTIHWTADQMEKQGYRHYMLKEIHEQPQAIAQTIENHIDHSEGIVKLTELENLAPFLRKVKRVELVACGTARHAAMIGKYYIEEFARIPVDVDYGSEFRYRNPILDEETLLVLVSQSGETADTLAACLEGKKRGIRTVCICNVRDSTLARESDIVLYTNAGPEIGVASTKAFTTQVAVLYMLAIELGHLRGNLTLEGCRELTQGLLGLPILVTKTLELEAQLEKIAKDHLHNTFFFYMGRGTSYPVALEGALKLKEISYVHAEGYCAGELKHGPIALIDRNTATVVIAPQPQPLQYPGSADFNALSQTSYEKMMSNLQEVKSRGGQVFSIGTEGDTSLEEESRFFVGIPRAHWALNPILTTIPVQLLAYYFALERGTDVDKPRNLAKSVTVE